MPHGSVIALHLPVPGGGPGVVNGQERTKDRKEATPTCVDLRVCRACLERAFRRDSASSSRTGVRYDLWRDGHREGLPCLTSRKMRCLHPQVGPTCKE